MVKRTKLLVSDTSRPYELAERMGPEWYVARPGALLSGRYELIMTPARSPFPGQEKEYIQWIDDILRCRLDIGGQLIKI